MGEDSPKPEDVGAVVEPAGSSSRPAPPASQGIEEIKAVARKFADDPLRNPDHGAWAVLTAISKKARERPQGMNIILNRDEHCIGRLVEDNNFRIDNLAISGRHCKIYREKVADDEAADPHVPVFLMDTSSNGTFLNWDRLNKSSRGTRLKHGDIISFLAAPHSEIAFAFVFREVSQSVCSNGSVLKRKSEEQFAAESKRIKGIGIGAPDGPISLDDFRSLRRSNMELRKQLEYHVLAAENMRTEAQTSNICHENEIKELRESITNSFHDEISKLRHELQAKRKELDDANAALGEQQHRIKDLNENLSASIQSRAEADEIINSQKATIAEREAELDEKRNQRIVEQEKAEADLKSALQRASEAEEEVKRQADIHLQQHRKQQECIVKLQEKEKESRLHAETLRSKLENTRESLVISEKKVRQLDVQLQEEQIASERNKKRSEMLELEIRRLKKELESEKVAREEAWAKVSVLELKIAAVIRELSTEKQKLQGARERIILRETQLRAFYSTTEEISALFAKQQEQLKAMQKTLEDEENYSMGFDLNVVATKDDTQALVRNGEASAQPSVNITTKPARANSSAKAALEVDNSSSNDDASVTEKHDCNMGSQDDANNTQDLECTSADRSVRGFGSDIDGANTAMVPEAEGNAVETERVPETESPGMDAGFDQRSASFHKCSNLAGETMQLEDDAQCQENIGHTGILDAGNNHCSKSKPEDPGVGVIGTADLLASEGLGSWANSTAPSAHGENDSPGSGANAGGTCRDVVAAAAVICSFDSPAAGSQSNAVVSGITRLTGKHRALSAMIDIVAPNFKEQFPRVGNGMEKNDSMSDAETEEGSDSGGDNDTEESKSGDDAMIEDSVT